MTYEWKYPDDGHTDVYPKVGHNMNDNKSLEIQI